MSVFNNTSIGTGNSTEQVVPTNGTITVLAGNQLEISDYIASVSGVVTIRIRDTNLAGAIVLELAFPKAALIGGDMKTPLQFKAVSANKILVITEQGEQRNVLVLTGSTRSLNLT